MIPLNWHRWSEQLFYCRVVALYAMQNEQVNPRKTGKSARHMQSATGIHQELGLIKKKPGRFDRVFPQLVEK